MSPDIEELIEQICDELHDLIVGELESAARAGRLWGMDPGRWVHERAGVIEGLVRLTSQENRP